MVLRSLTVQPFQELAAAADVRLKTVEKRFGKNSTQYKDLLEEKAGYERKYEDMKEDIKSRAISGIVSSMDDEVKAMQTTVNGIAERVNAAKARGELISTKRSQYRQLSEKAKNT